MPPTTAAPHRSGPRGAGAGPTSATTERSTEPPARLRTL